jgi:hypothetical protein
MAPAFRDWVAAIYAAKITPAARDTLIAYGLHMSRNGTIRISRDTIGEWTERGSRVLARHIQEGTRAGILEPIRGAGRGHPATYRATLPPDV